MTPDQAMSFFQDALIMGVVLGWILAMFGRG